DLAFTISIIAGVGYAMVALNGERKTTFNGPKTFNQGTVPAGVNTFAGPAGAMALATPYDFGILGTSVIQTAYYAGAQGAANAAWYSLVPGALAGNLIGQSNNGYYT